MTRHDAANDPGRELDRDVAGAAAAHQRLLADLDDRLERDDLDAAAPSALPGWTVGHVLTHLARQAESQVRMLDGLDQYEGGPAGRAAAIEAGAERPAAALVSDVRAAVWAVEGRWATQADWGTTVRGVKGPVPALDLPFLRWRETSVHHVDLGLGYGFADLPGDYVRLELRRVEMLWRARRPMGLTGLPAEALAVPPHHRLAWLLGRATIDGMAPAGVF